MAAPDRDLASLRIEYGSRGLTETDVDPDPFAQFRAWLDESFEAQLPEPYAMTLATATAEGVPAARIVLLRGVDERGFTFFTNYDSRKGEELARNPRAALVFFWAAIHRQVRVEGTVERVSAVESDAYWHSRPLGSRISAAASHQSQVIPGRDVLERRVAELSALYDEDDTVPRPAHWGGYRVRPASIEFWQGRRSRLHDRLRYLRLEDGTWRVERLAP